MKGNNKYLAGLANGELLGILTAFYAVSSYVIIHTAWLYNNQNFYRSNYYNHYVLINIAYFFLFLPFGVSTYYYYRNKNRSAFYSFIRGFFAFLSIGYTAEVFLLNEHISVYLFLLSLFYIFVMSPPGILYLWTHLDINQKTMTYSQDTQNISTSIFSKTNSVKTSPVSKFRQVLDQQVIGQSYAKEEIAKQIVTQLRKAQASGRNPRILGTFFFVGPTGVGKTETAKAISEYFKKSGYQFLRFDMGNFARTQDAATLTGSPRGYVGSKEGGALTRPLMSNPRAVILFDEMEKADPTLFRTFMTLIDEGEIQETSTGQRVTLNNAIIIFTSNLYQGSIKEIITEEKDPMIAELAIRNLLTGNYHDALKYVSREQIQMEKPPDRHTSYGMTSKFPPEFIGRIDKVVPFDSLSVEDYKVIVKRLATKYKKNVDVDLIVSKNLPIAESYGVRQFIKKVEEDILI